MLPHNFPLNNNRPFLIPLCKNYARRTSEYVIAIDLGTSCTAYSWKSAEDPTPSVGVPDMEPNEDIVGKSPTTLLVGGTTGADRVFKPSAAEAYGRVAQRRYAENSIPHGAQLFKRFKMVRKAACAVLYRCQKMYE